MANEKQIAYWNEVAGPKWVKITDEMDARFAAIADLLLATAAPTPGASVLDIGCGTGTSARLFAAAGARVTGIDISVPMLEIARARGGPAAGGAITYLEADAQTHPFTPRTFDHLVSRFGVMFFADPVAAFTNLRGAMSESGRLTFICWAPVADNPHWKIPFDGVRACLGDPVPRDPRAPGPLAFSDIAYVDSILTAAGFTTISITPTAVSIIGESLEQEAKIACLLGPAGALIEERQPDAATRAELLAIMRRSLSPFETEAGLSLPATVNVVTANH